MRLRRFNAAGIERFRTFIATLRSDKTRAAPIDLLFDDVVTEVVTPETDVPDATFANRLAAAEYLDRVLSPVGLADAFNDIGLWAWLSLRFFDQLRPLGPGISLKQLGVDEPRFIPSDNYTDRHRHLLRHPLQVYRMVDRNASQALCVLVQPIYRPGDVVEQLASRQTYSREKVVLATISALIVDPVKMAIRANASGKARRIVDVIDQFDCTWDLGYIAKDLLVPMLPDEFEEFRKPPSATEKRKGRKPAKL